MMVLRGEEKCEVKPCWKKHLTGLIILEDMYQWSASCENLSAVFSMHHAVLWGLCFLLSVIPHLFPSQGMNSLFRLQRLHPWASYCSGLSSNDILSNTFKPFLLKYSSQTHKHTYTQGPSLAIASPWHLSLFIMNEQMRGFTTSLFSAEHNLV